MFTAWKKRNCRESAKAGQALRIVGRATHRQTFTIAHRNAPFQALVQYRGCAWEYGPMSALMPDEHTSTFPPNRGALEAYPSSSSEGVMSVDNRRCFLTPVVATPYTKVTHKVINRWG